MELVPLRGWMVKNRSPAIWASSSLNTPAAFTTTRAEKLPRFVCSRRISPFSSSMPVTAVSKNSSAPLSTAFSA